MSEKHTEALRAILECLDDDSPQPLVPRLREIAVSALESEPVEMEPLGKTLVEVFRDYLND